MTGVSPPAPLKRFPPSCLQGRHNRFRKSNRSTECSRHPNLELQIDTGATTSRLSDNSKWQNSVQQHKMSWSFAVIACIERHIDQINKCRRRQRTCRGLQVGCLRRSQPASILRRALVLGALGGPPQAEGVATLLPPLLLAWLPVHSTRNSEQPQQRRGDVFLKIVKASATYTASVGRVNPDQTKVPQGGMRNDTGHR